MEERLKSADGEILADIHAGVATVTLNRPAALNSLTYGMLVALGDWLDLWAKDDSIRMVVLRGAGPKAFCAGGDIRALHAQIASGSNRHPEFFAIEYALDYRVHTYPKTVVANIDGIVMGGRMGISQGARVRLAGDRTRMAMPETIIGLFPDVGGSYFLSRVPGKLGAYLGLAGPTIGAADAIYCGLADVYVGTQESPVAELEALRPAIDHHFGKSTVEEIVASLGREEEPRYRDWAAKTLDALAKRSPTLLDVTLEQIRRGAVLSLADCFRMELNLMHACFEHGDMMEGIRALLEKDTPRWKPRSPIEPFFRPRWKAAAHPLASLR
ncbi:MAG TPA: enoyl-CoA hydratase/isomerase family protein [Usitatibacter sp.]|nr:enoyl-CoA hydratase/isomerase family protein [Usitatibacter sp.]